VKRSVVQVLTFTALGAFMLGGCNASSMRDRIEYAEEEGEIGSLIAIAKSRTESVPTRKRAIRVLGRTRSPEAVDALIGLLRDTTTTRVSTWILTPEHPYERPEQGAYAERVEERTYPTRLAAAEALGEIGDVRAIASLEERLGVEDDNNVKKAIRDALAKLLARQKEASEPWPYQ